MASSRCPVRDQQIKAGEFILGYPGEAGVPLRPLPQSEVLGRNGTFVGLRKYQSRVGAFNRFLRASCRDGRGAGAAGREAGGALAQRRTTERSRQTQDDPARGADPLRNNDFHVCRRSRTASSSRSARTCGALNPRDTKMALLADVNIHRIIRRSTTYGAPYDANAFSQQDDRGRPAEPAFHLHQRQGDGHLGVPAAGVGQ